MADGISSFKKTRQKINNAWRALIQDHRDLDLALHLLGLPEIFSSYLPGACATVGASTVGPRFGLVGRRAGVS